MKKKQTVNITRSETWMDDNFKDISEVLEQTINDFVDDDERIINIQVVERGGLSRFWVYTSPSSSKAEG